jgi:hypothetical protein
VTTHDRTPRSLQSIGRPPSCRLVVDLAVGRDRSEVRMVERSPKPTAIYQSINRTGVERGTGAPCRPHLRCTVDGVSTPPAVRPLIYITERLHRMPPTARAPTHALPTDSENRPTAFRNAGNHVTALCKARARCDAMNNTASTFAFTISRLHFLQSQNFASQCGQ